MKQLLCLLAVVCGTVTVATAGPNQGGVLWVHDTGIVFSTDLTLPPVSSPPADCAGVDNQQEADGVERVWKVYAAFAPGSHPRLKTCGWAIQFPEAASSPLSYVGVTGGGIPDEDGAGTDFYIADLGFPTASGGQIGQSFPSGPGPAPWLRCSTSMASATTPAGRSRSGARRRTALPATASSVMTGTRPTRTRSWVTAHWVSARRALPRARPVTRMPPVAHRGAPARSHSSPPARIRACGMPNGMSAHRTPVPRRRRGRAASSTVPARC